MNPHQKHTVVGISMKEILVDENIIPLVKWLNITFYDLNTYASCEGSSKGSCLRIPPYVMFHTPIIEDVQILARLMDGYGKLAVKMLNMEGYIPTMCFTMKFHNQRELSKFISAFCGMTKKQIKNVMEFTFELKGVNDGPEIAMRYNRIYDI